MTCLDAVIIGASCVEHISANMSYCEEGPLDDRKSESSRILECVVICCNCPIGVVRAFDEAWELDKQYSVNYFR